uniref:Uncharacterized protein n=1 Tax=Anguilla anguilla TaxID=7936 RepID=A0A0E9R6J9_ANGAN
MLYCNTLVIFKKTYEANLIYHIYTASLAKLFFKDKHCAASG